jgi:hypothetical protein
MDGGMIFQAIIDEKPFSIKYKHMYVHGYRRKKEDYHLNGGSIPI